MKKRSEDSRASLPSTRGSLLQRAAQDRQGLDEFVRVYWRPMRHFLVRLWGPQAQAEDVVQDFYVKKLLEGRLLEQFDPKRGHFRPFLKTALKNFAIAVRRHELTENPGVVSLDDSSVLPPVVEQEAVDAFDVEWARAVVKETEQRMHSECVAQQWQVFVGRLWAPLTRGAAVVTYEELRRQLGFQKTKDAANVLVHAKRRFHNILRSVVGESTTSEAGIRDELNELLRVLHSGSAAEWTHLLGSLPELTYPDPFASSGSVPGEGAEIAAHLSAVSPGKAAGVSPAAGDESLDAMDSAALVTALQIDVNTGLTAEDLAEILEFYLSTAASEFTGMADPRRRGRKTGHASAEEAPLTLGDLLQQSQPAIEPLEQVKRAARRESTRKDATIPRRIAEAIYFTSIAVALVRCGASISSSPPNVLRSGFDMLLGCDWLPSWQRQVLLDARQGLGSHG